LKATKSPCLRGDLSGFFGPASESPPEQPRLELGDGLLERAVLLEARSALRLQDREGARVAVAQGLIEERRLAIAGRVAEREGEAQRDDENYAYVAAWEYKGEGAAPALNKEPLTFDYVKPAQRSYK